MIHPDSGRFICLARVACKSPRLSERPAWVAQSDETNSCETMKACQLRLEGQAPQGTFKSENVPVTLQTGEADEKLEPAWPVMMVGYRYLS